MCAVCRVVAVAVRLCVLYASVVHWSVICRLPVVLLCVVRCVRVLMMRVLCARCVTVVSPLFARWLSVVDVVVGGCLAMLMWVVLGLGVGWLMVVG